jgi:hypothetical protein
MMTDQQLVLIFDEIQQGLPGRQYLRFRLAVQNVLEDFIAAIPSDIISPHIEDDLRAFLRKEYLP